MGLVYLVDVFALGVALQTRPAISNAKLIYLPNATRLRTGVAAHTGSTYLEEGDLERKVVGSYVFPVPTGYTPSTRAEH